MGRGEVGVGGTEVQSLRETLTQAPSPCSLTRSQPRELSSWVDEWSRNLQSRTMTRTL